jgi:hypothetical protein
LSFEVDASIAPGRKGHGIDSTFMALEHMPRVPVTGSQSRIVCRPRPTQAFGHRERRQEY